jgi:hypothetical protein
MTACGPVAFARASGVASRASNSPGSSPCRTGSMRAMPVPAGTPGSRERWSPLVRVAARLLPASEAIVLMLVEHTCEMDDRQALVGPSRHVRNRVN